MNNETPTSDKAEVTTSVPVTGDSDVRGTVRIAPAVLIQLIETTVRDIEGVASITSRKGKKREEEIAGKAFDDGKVRVIVDGDQIDAELAIRLTPGANVGTVSGKIRREVGLAAGRMLGMTVRSVDIYVDDFAASEA